jgi:transcriptional regulator with XRE-family HTH domain
MNRFQQNLKQLRKLKGYTQEQLALKMGIKRSLLGAYEEGRAEPPIERLQDFARMLGVSVDSLIAAPDIPSATRLQQVDFSLHQDKKILLVPHKAAAGYMSGYTDQEYVEELPGLLLPNVSGENHRAFELLGESMLPLPSGTVVIARKVERINELKLGKTYVLVTSTEGIVYKRIGLGSSLAELELISDNKEYAPYPIEKSVILEAWEAKMYLSNQMPEPS